MPYIDSYKLSTLQDKKIAVLLSGGVDSSVVVYELVRHGLMPDCFYIKIGPEENLDWDCSSEEDLEMAQSVAKRYGCTLEVVDCHKEYWDNVVKYTMDKVRSGFTPNPDVMCNRLIKFGAFHEKMGYKYDLIATGHYAQTEFDSQKRKWLVTSPDPVKDQTDFLSQIYDWQLKKAIFPIGHLLKDDVRRIAQQEHLASSQRKDSQGICFLGKINYNEYLRRYLGENPGDVVEFKTDKKIGTHKGLWFHTIGQRHGLGFGGGPWFVVGKETRRNILYVSKGYNPLEVYKSAFIVQDFHFLTINPYALNKKSFYERVNIKIRHTPEFVPAYFENTGDGDDIYNIYLDNPIHGVAPGQFCVVYDKDCHRCIGSAEICLDDKSIPDT